MKDLELISGYYSLNSVIIESNIILKIMFFFLFLMKRNGARLGTMKINSQRDFRLGLHKSKINRSSRPEMFFRKSVLKICSKFKGEHLCWSVISIKLESNFIEITLHHWCYPVNLLHIFRTAFPNNTSGRLLLK